MKLLLLLIPVLGFLSVEENEIEVISNPHDIKVCSTVSKNLDTLLEPYHLLTKPLQTQADTFLNIKFRKVLTVPIPVYHMKQPGRISGAELEFDLVLVKDLTKAGMTMIREVTVNNELAGDSWFPGYYWAPIVMSCDGNYWQHVGWKFTAGEQNVQTLPHFYALMVQLKDKETADNIAHIGGFRAPGWIASALI